MLRTSREALSNSRTVEEARKFFELTSTGGTSLIVGAVHPANDIETAVPIEIMQPAESEVPIEEMNRGDA